MAVTRRAFLQMAGVACIITGSGKLQKWLPANGLPPKKDVALRFIIASDGHYGQADTDYESKHKEMVDWINKEKKDRGGAFAFINGDLIHNDPKYLTEVKNVWDGLHLPYYVSHGNHDMVNENDWQQTFRHPWNYSFEQKGVAFVVLNTADISGKYICPDVDYTKQQLEKYKAFPHVYVFMHITPFGWTGAGLPCPEIVAVFDGYKNIKAIFHGHDHDQDDVKENNGKHYFFDSHVAGNWGTSYRGYRVVEVLKSGDTFTYQMNAKENLTVNKNTVV